MFNSAAFSALIKTRAEAPSFKVDAFAAVIVPSLSNTGRNAGIFSILTFLYSSSSEIIKASPLLCGTSTGTISLANFPSFHDCELLLYDSIAKASCSSRLNSISLAQVSAQTPI